MTKGNGLQRERHTQARPARRVGEAGTCTNSLRRVILWKGRMRKEDRGSPRHLGSSSSCAISSRKAAFSWLGDTDVRVGLWLAGGVNQKYVHSLGGTGQPTGTEHTLISSLLLENQLLFMHKSSNNSGFTYLAHENLAKYVTCGKVRIPRVAKSMTQTQDLVIYPAGNGGKVNPRRDRNSSRLGTRAGGMSCLQVARQWEEGAALTRAPRTCWAARQQGRRLAALPLGPPALKGHTLVPSALQHRDPVLCLSPPCLSSELVS